MKVLKFILIVFVTLVVLFFGIGYVKPSFEYGNTIIVKSPREKCWAVYTDFSQKHKWIDGFKEEKLLAGSPLAVGAEYETIIESDEVMIMNEKISAIIPNEKIEWQLTNDVLYSTYSYSFKGDSTTTAVTTQYRIAGKNAFMKSVLYLFKSFLNQSDVDMLTAFKKTAELKN